MKKRVVQILGVIIVAAIIFGTAHSYHRRIEQRQNAVVAETDMLRIQMKNAYQKRGTALRAWAKGTPFEKEDEFYSLLVENDGLELRTQPEFDRYDWVQEQLNLKITKLLTDKKYAKKKPAEWESLERGVAEARAAYAKQAITTNRNEKLPMRQPVFKAEEVLSPVSKSD